MSHESLITVAIVPIVRSFQCVYKSAAFGVLTTLLFLILSSGHYLLDLNCKELFFFFLSASSLVAEDGSCYFRMNLKDWFLNSHALRQHGVLDGAIRGMVYHNSMTVDGKFSTDVMQRQR